MSSVYIRLPYNAGSGGSINSITSSSSLITTSPGPNVVIGFDESQMPEADGARSVVVSYECGENLSALEIVYMDALGGQIFAANQDNLIEASAIGITKQSGNVGQMVEVLQFGIISDSSFVFTPASIIFLDLNGQWTLTAPTAGYLTRLGRAINSTTALVLIETPVQL